MALLGIVEQAPVVLLHQWETSVGSSNGIDGPETTLAGLHRKVRYLAVLHEPNVMQSACLQCRLLATQASRVLDPLCLMTLIGLRREILPKGSPFPFHGDVPDQAVSNAKLLAQDVKVARILDVLILDLCHSFAGLVSGGASLEMIGHLARPDEPNRSALHPSDRCTTTAWGQRPKADVEAKVWGGERHRHRTIEGGLSARRSLRTVDTGSVLAEITLHNLDDDLKRRLRLRAAESGRSMEEELQEILCQSLGPPSVPENLGQLIHAQFAAIGCLSCAEVPRGSERLLPAWSDARERSDRPVRLNRHLEASGCKLPLESRKACCKVVAQ